MSNSNGKITKPVKTQDVATVIGVTSSNVSTLCTSNKINKWAKYKPVKHPKYTELTEADRQSVHYGITQVPLFTNQLDMAKFMNDGSSSPLNGTYSEYWKYEYPGAKDPKRLGDYNGYLHTGTQFIMMMDATEIDVRYGSDPVNFDFPVATEAENLKISDFDYRQLWTNYDTVNSGARYYLGVCMTDGKESGTRLVTQTVMINNSLSTVTVNGKKCVRISVPHDVFMATPPPAGNLTVFPFVTDYTIPQLAVPGGTGRPAIPFTMAKSVVRFITGDAFLVTWGEVTWTSPSMTTRNITVKVQIKNQSGTNLYIDTTKQGTFTIKDSAGTVNKSVSLLPPNIEIKDGQTYTATLTFDGYKPSSYTLSINWTPYTGETHTLTKTVDIS